MSQETSPIDLKARHNARKHIVQALYQWQLTGQPIHEIEEQFMHEFMGNRVELSYFKEILYGIPTKSKEIDDAFTAYLLRDTIDPIELSIIQLSVFELLFRLDIPYQVVINEALELAKTFGSQDSHRFVNGILDKVAQQVRKTEWRARKPSS